MLQLAQLLDGREITVVLPPRYGDETDRRYPVLYLHDGQNLFDPRKAFAGEAWGVDRTAEALIVAGRIEPLILVGIDHRGVERINEFTPTHDRKRGGGGADRYAQLIADDVKTLVDARYRTLREPRHTGVGGSSLGGLVSLFLVLKRPDLFGTAAVMSPSVWWDRRAILRDVRRAASAFDSRERPRLWVDMGTAESRGQGSARRVLEDARLLHAGLLKAGWVDDRDLHYEEIEGGTHSERAWGDRFERVLAWLFPPGTGLTSG
jgi:predicted alpha/beta superfamily hydrolase